MDKITIGKSKYNYLIRTIKVARLNNVNTLQQFEDFIVNARFKHLDQVKANKEKTGKVVYENYINSKKWYTFRKGYIERNGKNCQLCEIKLGKHLHHMTYKRLGKEKDTDLLFLCEDCHHNIHHGKSGIKTTKTKEMLINLVWLRENHGFDPYSTSQVVRMNLSMRL